MSATNISFKICVYLAPILITLSISDLRDPPCATLEKLTIAHTFRMRMFSSLPDPDQYGSFIDLLVLNESYPEY